MNSAFVSDWRSEHERSAQSADALTSASSRAAGGFPALEGGGRGVGAESRAAVERGNAALCAWMQLLESGTDEQIAEEEWRRGAMIRMDIVVARALDEFRGLEARRI